MYKAKIKINHNYRGKLYLTLLTNTVWDDYKKADGSYKVIQDFGMAVSVITTPSGLFHKSRAIADVYTIKPDALYITCDSISDVLKTAEILGRKISENLSDKIEYIKLD